MADELDDATKEWIARQERTMDEGHDLVQKASDEAVDYMADAFDNILDRQWRKMSMETQAIEIGIGIAIAEYLVPVIYEDMRKNLHKKTKVKKETAEALRHIYIGRVIKNIRKALNDRAKQEL